MTFPVLTELSGHGEIKSSIFTENITSMQEGQDGPILLQPVLIYQ